MDHAAAMGGAEGLEHLSSDGEGAIEVTRADDFSQRMPSTNSMTG
jgi:hypothetical protein